ncbi:hypothetical protein [Dongia sp.]|uniref:hypothetical protein n=1 Tax=Dongia sp. TaxID=1977262 RepID=UPI0035AFCE08
MQMLIRSFVLCLMILAVAVNGRFAEVAEDGLSDAPAGISLQADAGHHPGSPDDSGATKSACHGAIGCHVLFVTAAAAEIEFSRSSEAFVDFQSSPIGTLAFDHLRPPIFLS